MTGTNQFPRIDPEKEDKRWCPPKSRHYCPECFEWSYLTCRYGVYLPINATRLTKWSLAECEIDWDGPSEIWCDNCDWNGVLGELLDLDGLKNEFNPTYTHKRNVLLRGHQDWEEAQ